MAPFYVIVCEQLCWKRDGARLRACQQPVYVYSPACVCCAVLPISQRRCSRRCRRPMRQRSQNSTRALPRAKRTMGRPRSESRCSHAQNIRSALVKRKWRMQVKALVAQPPHTSARYPTPARTTTRQHPSAPPHAIPRQHAPACQRTPGHASPWPTVAPYQIPPSQIRASDRRDAHEDGGNGAETRPVACQTACRAVL